MSCLFIKFEKLIDLHSTGLQKFFVEHPHHEKSFLGHLKIFMNRVESCCNLEEGNDGKVRILNSLVGLITR